MTVGNISSNNATLTYAEKTMSTENYYRQLLKQKQESVAEELEKAQSKPVQTGSEKFTQKQWNSFLKDYDELAEYAREEMRLRHEKQYEKQIEREERAREAVKEDYLEAVQEAKRNRARELQELRETEWYQEKKEKEELL